MIAPARLSPCRAAGRRRAIAQLCRLGLAAWLLGLAMVATAETNYVIDRLLVGVHEDQDLNSAIIKVLPTGTRLEVLTREGELAQVADADGTRGWVDAAYLTADVPSTLRVAELEREKTRLEQALAAAADGAPAAAVDGTQVDALTKENTSLKGKLSEERLRAGKLQSEVAALRAAVGNQDAPVDQRIVELQRDRERLAEALEDAEQKVSELSARASLTATADLVPLLLREYAGIIALLLLVVVVSAAAFGAWAIDALNRRRHGGFRV